jgi:hypothetical protein
MRELFAAAVIIFLLSVMAVLFYLALPLTPATIVVYPDIAQDATKCPGCTKVSPVIPVKRKFEDLIEKTRGKKYE